METVVIIIMALVSFSFILKLTFHRPAGAVLLASVAAVTMILTYNEAASQSKSQIADWLQNPGLMLDTSVWLTIDVAFQLCFCSICAKSVFGRLSKKESIAYGICLWIPGLLIFPVLFAVLTQLIFAMPGTDFALIGWISAGVLLIATPLMGWGIKWLLPESDLRLELMFIINLLIVALGVVATVNGRTAAVGTNAVEWDALIGVFALLFIGFVTGIFYNKIITDRRINQLQKR